MDSYDKIPTLAEIEQSGRDNDFWSSWKWMAFLGLPFALAWLLDFMGYRRAGWAILIVVIAACVDYVANRVQKQRNRIEDKLDALIAKLNAGKVSPEKLSQEELGINEDITERFTELSDDMRDKFGELSADLSKLHSDIYKLSLDMHYLKQK